MTIHQSETDLSLAKALELSPDVVRTLENAATPKRLKRGEILIEENSDADALFFVVSGRFTVVAAGTPIAEIGPGEPIGEIAFFGGGTRTASVIAARASQVLELSRDAYEDALKREPVLSTAIIAALARRLRRAIPTAQLMRPRPPQIIGIVPGGSAPLDLSAVESLASAFEEDGASVVRTPSEIGQDANGNLALEAYADRRLVLVCEDPIQQAAWADQIF